MGRGGGGGRSCGPTFLQRFRRVQLPELCGPRGWAPVTRLSLSERPPCPC